MAHGIDRTAVESFIYSEAAMLDAGELQRWLNLFADDGVYWVPSRADLPSPDRHVSIIYDDAARLRLRVDRLISGKEYAQMPASVTCRQITNLMINLDDAGVTATAVMVVYEKRPNTAMQTIPTHTTWRLAATVDGWRILEKRVVLVDIDRYFENLAFIL